MSFRPTRPSLASGGSGGQGSATSVDLFGGVLPRDNTQQFVTLALAQEAVPSVMVSFAGNVIITRNLTEESDVTAASQQPSFLLREEGGSTFVNQLSDIRTLTLTVDEASTFTNTTVAGSSGIIVSGLSTGTLASPTTEFQTGSIAPEADALVLLFLAFGDNPGTIIVTSVSGAGLTWTTASPTLTTGPGGLIVSAVVYRGIGGSPSPGQLTVKTDVASTRAGWCITQFAHVNPVTPIVQSTYIATTVATTVISLSPFASTLNVAAGLWSGLGLAPTTGSGFAVAGKTTLAGGGMYQTVEYATNSTAVTNPSAVNPLAWAAEIQAG